MNEHGPLMDESVLRRALRLEADEIPSRRLDPALVAAAARAGIAPRTVAVAVMAAFAAGWLWSEAVRVVASGLAAAGLDPLGAAIEVVAAAAVQLAPLAEVATQPTIPLALLTAAAMAVIFERRGRVHAKEA
ncbi:MAG: hypothetical protein HYX56_05205 [Chloroflexi bacterium]|nr:hypothetical protein [Chloroflexota bacterium]